MVSPVLYMPHRRTGGAPDRSIRREGGALGPLTPPTHDLRGIAGVGLPSVCPGGSREWTVLLSGRIKRSWAVESVVLVATAFAAAAGVAATSGAPALAASSGSGRSANTTASPVARPAPASTRPRGRAAHPTTPTTTRVPATPSPVALAGCPVPPQPPPPASPPAVAPGGPGDLPSAGDSASGVDLPRRGSHR